MPLFDTNKTGKDNNFNNGHRVGFVSKHELTEAGLCCRVVFPDKDDLVSKPYPVMQRAAGGSQDFDVPAIGEQVVVATLPNGPEEGFIEGTIYSASSPPPSTDPNKRMTRFADGTLVEYDKAAHTMLIDAAGPITIRTTGPVRVAAEGRVDITSASTVSIEAPTIRLEAGEIELLGEIRHTGNMLTIGIHDDNLGRHS